MTLIKICGITSWDSAKAAIDAGADLLGFVCDAHSERAVDIDIFCEMAMRIPSRIVKVGVLDRDPHPAWALRPDAIRLFNRIQYYDDAVWPNMIRENWDMSRKIKAFHVNREADLRTIANFNGLVQSYLVNVNIGDVKGYANPETYGWTIASDVHQYGKRLYLAGGLTPDNVAEAIRQVHPYGVDVTVGVESAPGVKDVDKMRAFVNAVRKAGK